MRKILAITWKDALLRFSTTSEWLFFLILPIVFTVILAGGTGGDGDDRIRLLVVDQAQSSLSQELIDTLIATETVRPEMLLFDEAETIFAERNAAAMLVIPAAFNLDNLIDGPVELELRQQPNNMNAMVVSRAVQAVTGRISSGVDIARAGVVEAERIRPFASDGDRQEYFDAALQRAQDLMESAPDRLEVVQGVTQDSIEYDPRANTSAGQLITWVFVPLIGISGTFAYERENGTLRRLLTTPTQKAIYLFGTIFGQVVMALVQMLLLVGFGILVMNLNWGHTPAALAVILVASALAAAALGTTLGTFVKTESQASGLSIMLGMVMALLGGCWYPIELFPQFVRDMVLVLPTRWAMQGMLDIVLRGHGLAAVLPEAGVLVGFAAVFFTIGVLRFRYE
jgi:ABC-2 type transport system permease protein